MLDLSVIIPSKGREELRDTLDSIPKEKWIEVIVVADGPEARRNVEAIWDGPTYEVSSGVWGHAQRNLGMEKANGRWLCFMDDDDVYTPEAFPAFQEAMRYRKPRLFRMKYDFNDIILWEREEIAPGNVSTQMLLVPNNPNRLGQWPSKRCGDYDFIRDTVRLWDGVVIWEETIVAELRDRDGHIHTVGDRLY